MLNNTCIEMNNYNNIKIDLINELNNSQIKIDDDVIKFIKNNKTIFIYIIKNSELLTALYLIGDILMKKYDLSKLEYTELTKNIIKFNL